MSDQGPSAHDLPPVSGRRLRVVLTLVAAGFALLFVLGGLPRFRAYRHARAAAEEEAAGKPVVEAGRPARERAAGELTLPADVRAWQTTSLYPRTTGYIKTLLVDIGDRVSADQLLAEIATPEVDAELLQARAALDQARTAAERTESDYQLAQATLVRYEGFARSGGVTQQQLDERRSAERQAWAALQGGKANVSAAAANVSRLEALQGFERVAAPFPGTVATRGYDIGALVSPGSSGPGRELFRIDRTDILRVFIDAPQQYVGEMQIGREAAVTVRNYPGRSFSGTIARTAGSLDPGTRTLRVEIDVTNAENLLFAGMYGEVRLPITRAPALLIPTSATLFDTEGTRVALVKDDRVHFQKVTLGRDLGKNIEVLEGLHPDDLVIRNPGQRLVEGGPVRTASGSPPQEKEQHGGGATAG